MKKHWKSLLLLAFATAIAIPAYLYGSALDWERKHRAHVQSLPLLQPDSEDGEYQLRSGDMTFRARVAGLRNDGPNVILLHGFPESSIVWDELLPIAAASGYRMLAFDQRGYSPDARPSGAENYAIPLLIDDLLSVADTIGFDRFHLAGHDWGAVVGWFTSMAHEDRLLSWTALSIPHAGAFFKGAVMDPVQSKRSGYVRFLQRPLVPEFMMTIRYSKALEDMFSRVPSKNREEYIRIQSEPGALTAALNWYRAIDLDDMANNNTYLKSVSVPTLFIWGTEDLVISEGVIKNARDLMPEDYTEVPLEAGHALMQHAPDEVIPLMINHWQQHTP